ncbi:Aldehyde dehydrogenase domain [Dillenia turbinata]|uniref:Aldehyde dehydrogenase domain n=1 Tax=Dillenia turbinata TaxID=194707 RepID=A0AAN8UG84_9MAGN
MMSQICIVLLAFVKAKSLVEAINIVNENKYCNGASIFTKSAKAARKFQTEIEVGQESERAWRYHIQTDLKIHYAAGKAVYKVKDKS